MDELAGVNRWQESGLQPAASMAHRMRLERENFAATSPKTLSPARRAYDVLHGLGIDHAKFTHTFRGLKARLTRVEEAHVVKANLA